MLPRLQVSLPKYILVLFSTKYNPYKNTSLPTAVLLPTKENRESNQRTLKRWVKNLKPHCLVKWLLVVLWLSHSSCTFHSAVTYLILNVTLFGLGNETARTILECHCCSCSSSYREIGFSRAYHFSMAFAPYRSGPMSKLLQLTLYTHSPDGGTTAIV